MITIFHGNNTALSRKQYIDAKQTTSNPLTFEGNAVSLEQLSQALEGQSLFGGESQIFIEELLSKRKASKDLEKLISYLSEQSKENTIVLWESKELTPKQINSFGKPTVKKFDIPKEVFAFLDSLLPNNAKQTITLFHRVLETEEPEFVFFMIVRQFRMMLGIIQNDRGVTGLGDPRRAPAMNMRTSDGGVSRQDPERENFMTGPQKDDQIDELKRLAPWQKNKLTKQASAFGINKLVKVYHQLFSIEAGMKTGQLPENLEQTIDMFLLTL